MLTDTEPRKGMSFFYSKLPDQRGRDGAMGRREVINEPSPGVSWSPVQGIDSSGRNGTPAWRGRVGGTEAGTRQGLRTKPHFQLDLKSSSEQDPNSNLGPRQNPGFGPDLNSGHRWEQNTQATMG